MVFYFYEEAMREVTKISVDGLVPKSFHLSHWEGNKTPAPLKADTATEVVLRYLSHPNRRDLFPEVRIITNNHFDTDGLLAIWALLNPKKAQPMAGRLISAAEAGDFSVFSSEEGLQVHLLVQALCHAEESPFRGDIETFNGPKEAAYYKMLLPMVPSLFWKKASYRALWEPPFKQILHSMQLFEKGLVGLEEYEEGLSVVISDQAQAPQAIEHYCQGNLFLIIRDRQKGAGGFAYELLYRYYAWAETVTRPRIKQVSMTSLAEALKAQEENASGVWMTEGYAEKGMTSVLKYCDNTGALAYSPLHPEKVVDLVCAHLKKSQEEEVD